ncbi:hypothetical protein HNR46_003589 [Haloferula luteola]|uniref:Uncharacterized protein n=1 Tax=Haloferula luteola TaxID=595692 RepID=A0A840V6P0_9BACT|nr:hypothetical protein [Haloferula luteola]MBB5353333.1 hypothetical protein [Haloferula luteola]
MKKFFALSAAFLSGGYLLTLGILPDAVPFIDEATALIILVKSLQVLGIDLSRFVPFLRSGKKAEKKDGSPVVDV